MSRIEEKLSDQFFEWEERGRGWRVWPAPVSPEPPFRPFYGHYLPESHQIDDGQRPTFLSSLMERLSGSLTSQRANSAEPPDLEEEPDPTFLDRDSTLEITVSLPETFSAKPQEFAQVLTQLSSCKEPVSFEILGVAERIVIQVAMHPDDAPHVRRQLKAHFPDAVLVEAQGLLENTRNTRNGYETAVVEFGLGREFMFPLAESVEDPFVGIVGALAELAGEEL